MSIVYYSYYMTYGKAHRLLNSKLSYIIQSIYALHNPYHYIICIMECVALITNLFICNILSLL